MAKIIGGAEGLAVSQSIHGLTQNANAQSLVHQSIKMDGLFL
jgi:hypothetical protein